MHQLWAQAFALMLLLSHIVRALMTRAVCLRVLV